MTVCMKPVFQQTQFVIVQSFIYSLIYLWKWHTRCVGRNFSEPCDHESHCHDSEPTECEPLGFRVPIIPSFETAKKAQSRRVQCERTNLWHYFKVCVVGTLKTAAMSCSEFPERQKNTTHQLEASDERGDSNCSAPVVLLCVRARDGWRGLGPTFMPNVITVISILKIRARASCHRAV